MRPVDADAFDKVLRDAQLECKKNGGNFRYGVLATVRANLEKAPTVGGWVSVKDRLPDKPCGCLVFNIYGWRALDYWKGDGWAILDENEITHWMPLPEPPKEVPSGNEH